MKTKCLLLFLAALISAPLISFIATAYIASFFPEGTFRKIETPAIGLSKGSGTASGIGQSGSEKSLLPNEPITFVGKNAQVYVNNLA